MFSTTFKTMFTNHILNKNFIPLIMKKIGINPLFILLGIFICLIGYWKTFFVYFIVVILHEFAHKIIANSLGYKMDKIFLMPYGAGISFNQNFIDEKDEALIAIAGPVFNFILAFTTITLWWIFPSIYTSTELFVFANIVIGLFNLLPIYPLDGGRILTCYLTTKNFNRKKSLRFCFIFNYIFTAIFLFLFIIDIKNNFTYLIMAIFIFLGTFENKLSSQFELKNFPLFNHKLNKNKILKVNLFSVNGNTQIYKTAKFLNKKKINLIYILLENKQIKIINDSTISGLFLKYPATTTFNQIFNAKD